MKTKLIILATLCFCLNTHIEAQGKLKKITDGLMGSGKLDASKLPEIYQFDWEYKTEIKAEKNEPMEMNYLIGPNKDYFGMEMSSKESKQMGNVSMVMDSKAGITTMFMNANGQNMAQMMKIPDPDNDKKNEPNYSFKEIGTKTILGYESYGIELENADYKGTMYFTLDAPVNFSAFFAFSNNKNGPKGFDPALLKVLAEDALLMEMNFEHKKKKKQSFTMTAVSLEKKETIINKKDYQFIKMGF
uniref:DUF4412 domain-containing protein n=1 Tax=Mariniflexile sp. TaxID=1979402 RepID=UPI0040470E84